MQQQETNTNIVLKIQNKLVPHHYASTQSGCLTAAWESGSCQGCREESKRAVSHGALKEEGADTSRAHTPISGQLPQSSLFPPLVIKTALVKITKDLLEPSSS